MSSLQQKAHQQIKTKIQLGGDNYSAKYSKWQGDRSNLYTKSFFSIYKYKATKIMYQTKPLLDLLPHFDF